MKKNYSWTRPRPKPVTTIVEEGDEEDKELENEGSLRKRVVSAVKIVIKI